MDKPAVEPALPGRPSTIHGTVVASPSGGMLLRGPSGAGKSDLALRLIHTRYQGLAPLALVADDRVVLTLVTVATALGPAIGLAASAPAPLYGLLEVRGVGILTLPAMASCQLRLVIDLVDPALVPRDPSLLPAAEQVAVLAGHALPRRLLAPWEESAALKAILHFRVALAEASLALPQAAAHFP